MPDILARRYANAIAPRYAPEFARGYPIEWMRTVEETRRLRLAELRKEAGSLVALNERVGLTARDSTLSQILNQAENSRTKKPKVMGSELARKLEEKCGKPVGWMDSDPDAGVSYSKEVSELALAAEALPPDLKRRVLFLWRGAIDLAHEEHSEALDVSQAQSEIPRKVG